MQRAQSNGPLSVLILVLCSTVCKESIETRNVHALHTTVNVHTPYLYRYSTGTVQLNFRPWTQSILHCTRTVLVHTLVPVPVLLESLRFLTDYTTLHHTGTTAPHSTAQAPISSFLHESFFLELYRGVRTPYSVMHCTGSFGSAQIQIQNTVRCSTHSSAMASACRSSVSCGSSTSRGLGLGLGLGLPFPGAVLG